MEMKLSENVQKFCRKWDLRKGDGTERMLLSDWLIIIFFFFFFLKYFIPRLCIETMFVCFSCINKRFMIDLWLFLLIFSFQIFLQTPTYIPDYTCIYMHMETVGI